MELPDTEDITRCVADMREFLKDWTIPERKALMRNFVEGIEVMGEAAALTCTVPCLATVQCRSRRRFLISSSPAHLSSTRFNDRSTFEASHSLDDEVGGFLVLLLDSLRRRAHAKRLEHS